MKKIRRFFQREVIELEFGWYNDQFLTNEYTVIESASYYEPDGNRLAGLILIVDLIIVTLYYL